MNYRLKKNIDVSVQGELRKCCLFFSLEANGLLKVFKYQVDVAAKSVLVYLSDPVSLPDGELPFSVISVKGIYGVFTVDNRAAILEASSSILESY